MQIRLVDEASSKLHVDTCCCGRLHIRVDSRNLRWEHIPREPLYMLENAPLDLHHSSREINQHPGWTFTANCCTSFLSVGGSQTSNFILPLDYQLFKCRYFDIEHVN